MYNEYFGLHDSPFSIAPNPEYLYMSERHREALAHLLYGIRSDGGFILITGEVGTGKTTVCRCLLEQIPDDIDTAFVLNPKLTAHELLATICDDLGIEYPPNGTIKGLVDVLSKFLLESHHDGRRTVLIIDEAQNLSVDVLEQLRLLTNLETNQRKLLQVILLGQPELLTILSRPELRQLSQRITARFHLDTLNREEVLEYIDHRLSIAGAPRQLLSRTALRRICKLSGGTPRLINLLCDRALLGAWVEGRSGVNKRIVNKAAREVLGQSSRYRPGRAFAGGLAAVLLITVGVIFNDYPRRQASEFLAAATDERAGKTDSPTRVHGHADEQANGQRDESAAIVAATMGDSEAVDSRTRETTEVTRVTGHHRREPAFADLFTLWGTPLPANTAEPCTLADTSDLECIETSGSLREIEHLNRPALIRLSLDKRDHWFTLTGLDQDYARILAGDREFTVTRQEFLSRWDGQYTLLWHTPPNYIRPVQQGDKGPITDWLVAQLNAIDDRETQINTGHEFDQTLEERVKRFQISVGLNPDGIVGARTWIHLNSQQGADVPLLTLRNKG